MNKIHDFSQISLGIDAKRAFRNNVGLGNYSRNLIHNLEKSSFESIGLYSPKGPNQENLKFQQKLNKSQTIVPEGLDSLFWRDLKLSGVLEKNKIQLFHGLSHTLPYKLKCKSVVTMHDLIFLKHPEYFSLADRISYKLRFKYAAQSSDHIISISEHTKRDLVELLKVPEEKITVTYQPCSENFFVKHIDDACRSLINEKFNISKKPFLLYVGTIEKRKNLAKAVAAFGELDSRIQAEYDFLVIGKKTEYYSEVEEQIKKYGLENKIKYSGFVSNEDLVDLYNLAYLFVYPSLYEGFGIPVLEAMQCGTPALTSNTTSLLEVGGEASFLVDPESVSEIHEQLKIALTDSGAYSKKIACLSHHILKFSPHHTTQSVLDVYGKVLGL